MASFDTTSSAAVDSLRYPTIAHEKSSSFILDPAYSAVKKVPCAETTTSSNQLDWVYGDGELESYRLCILRQRTRLAKLNVWYPGSFHVPTGRGFFRIFFGKDTVAPHQLLLHSNGSKIKVYFCSEEDFCIAEMNLLYMSENSNEVNMHTINDIKSGVSLHSGIVVEVETQTHAHSENEKVVTHPPCISLNNESLQNGWRNQWEWSLDGQEWSDCQHFAPDPSANYPHLAEEPEVIIRPKETIKVKEGKCCFNLIYDFKVELFGRIVVPVFKSGDNDVPKLYVGESMAEVSNEDVSNQEQSTELGLEKSSGNGQQIFITKNDVAFRYARIVFDWNEESNNNIFPSLYCRATFHPVQYKGAMACSDETLTRIWYHAAYTLRLCMNDFILDGMKRDRLPWAGDLIVSLLSNAFVFADKNIVAKTLTVLGRAGISESHINGFADYSLLWIICHDFYQLYFGDYGFLRREWSRIKQSMDIIIGSCKDSGFLPAEQDNIFIDWVTSFDKTIPLQIIYWKALGCASALAKRMNISSLAESWFNLQERVKEMILDIYWNQSGSGILPPRHACILAAAWGFPLPDKEYIAQALMGDTIMPPTGTPYMKIFECLAFSRLGRSCESLQKMQQYWGGMIDCGATTFWEAYEPSETINAVSSFYNRPFGRSMCHAWGAGPCHFIPEALFQIRPTSDGWKTWECCCPSVPKMIDFMYLTIPTPYGDIELELTKTVFSITVPDGATMKLEGKNYLGPTKVRR